MPIISSGASWLPNKDTHGMPTSSANFCTKADLPIPGAPQIKIGRLGAKFSNSSKSSFCVRVKGKFMNLLRNGYILFSSRASNSYKICLQTRYDVTAKKIPQTVSAELVVPQIWQTLSAKLPNPLKIRDTVSYFPNTVWKFKRR